MSKIVLPCMFIIDKRIYAVYQSYNSVCILGTERELSASENH